MPIESIIVSALVVAVFSTFGIALAYAEHQTRNLKGRIGTRWQVS